MYGNEKEPWVMVKPLLLNGFQLDKVGDIFEIGPYYSVPHGYTSIQHEGILLYIPDQIFVQHFSKKTLYDQYVRIGSIIRLDINGNFGDYVIKSIQIPSDGMTASLEVEHRLLIER